MYAFFMSLKQADGSFTVMKDGEVDVRYVYFDSGQCFFAHMCIVLMVHVRADIMQRHLLSLGRRDDAQYDHAGTYQGRPCFYCILPDI